MNNGYFRQNMYFKFDSVILSFCLCFSLAAVPFKVFAALEVKGEIPVNKPFHAPPEDVTPNYSGSVEYKSQNFLPSQEEQEQNTESQTQESPVEETANQTQQEQSVAVASKSGKTKNIIFLTLMGLILGGGIYFAKREKKY